MSYVHFNDIQSAYYLTKQLHIYNLPIATPRDSFGDSAVHTIIMLVITT